MQYLDSQFEQRFGSSPHEGRIPRELNKSKEKGEKWCINKLSELYSWMLDDSRSNTQTQNRRSNCLLYDAVLVCREISQKITHSGSFNASHREHEISKNQRRLSRIIETAGKLYENSHNRSALKALIHASSMIDDYKTLADILEDVHVVHGDYAFVKNHWNALELSVHPPILRMKQRRRQEAAQKPKEEYHLSPARENSVKEVGQNYMASARDDMAGMSEMEAILVGAATSDSKRELRF